MSAQNHVQVCGKKLLKGECYHCHCMEKGMALWGQASDSFIYNPPPKGACPPQLGVR